MTEDAIKTSTQKIAEYGAGYGSVMFFEDQTTIAAISTKLAAFVTSSTPRDQTLLTHMQNGPPLPSLVGELDRHDPVCRLDRARS